MPIEFRCHHCHTLLRVGDDAAGMQAKCPKCGALLPVPERAASAGPAAPPALPLGPARPAEPPNPYETPAVVRPPPVSQGPFLQEPIVPTPLDVGDILQRAWRVYIDNLGNCLLLVLSFIGLAVAGYFGFILVAVVIGGVLGQVLGPSAAVLIAAVFGLALLALFVFVFWLHVGMTIFFLKLARGQDARIGELFRGGPYLLPMIGVSLVLYLMIFGAVALCAGLPAVLAYAITRDPTATAISAVAGSLFSLVPVAFIALVYFPVTYVVIDRQAGVTDAFSMASEMTRGNRLALLLLLLLSFGISMIAGCIPFGGLLVMPLTTLLAVIAYLRMTGQRTAGAPPQFIR